jgi:DNA-binding response OmpR family regulator
MSDATGIPRVIVVDDEPVITYTIEQILNSQGFEAKGVLSGEDALALARHFMPDILVSDIRMGDLDGIQTARRVRRFCPYCKVVLFTATILDDGQLQEVRRLGFDFLRKPLHPVRLLAHLRMLDTRFMQEVPANEGLRVLRQHCEGKTELVFEGKIYGEQADGLVVITNVLPTDMAVTIRLTELDHQPERTLWLSGGRFSYASLEDAQSGFAPLWRSVLQVEFDDGNELVFREKWKSREQKGRDRGTRDKGQEKQGVGS